MLSYRYYNQIRSIRAQKFGGIMREHKQTERKQMKLTKLDFCPMPGATAYTLNRCTIFLGVEHGKIHLSIAHPDRLPTWQEVKEARELLIDDNITVGMILPPKAEYVNIHEFCFHLWEIDQ